MSTLSDVLSFSRVTGLTDINGLTDTDGIIFANEALFDFRRRFVNSGIDALGIQESYCDGAIPPTGDGSTFLYPTDMMFLKAIEVNFQDTAPQNYLRAEQVDQSNLPSGQSFSALRLNASTQYPQFADNGDWYEIFPSFTSSNNLSRAIRVIYFLKPTPYIAVGDTISYPESLDYRILGWRIVSNFYYSLNKFAEGDAYNSKYEERVKQFIGTLGRGTQQPLDAVPIQLTGWEF